MKAFKSQNTYKSQTSDNNKNISQTIGLHVSQVFNDSMSINKPLKEIFRQSLKPEKTKYVVDPHTVKLNKIPDHVKKMLNVKSQAKPPHINQIYEMCNNKYQVSNKESDIKDTLTKFSMDENKTKAFNHQRTYSGNLTTKSFDLSNINLFYSTIKGLDKNSKVEQVLPKKKLSEHSPFSLYKFTKCHRYHTDINNNIINEDQLYKDQHFITNDTGHIRNLDNLNKNLTSSMLPLSIPIFPNKLKRGDSFKTNTSDNNINNISKLNRSQNLEVSCGFGSESIRTIRKKSSDNLISTKMKLQKKNSEIIISDLLDSKIMNSTVSKKRLIQNEIENSQKNFFKRKSINDNDFTLNYSIFNDNKEMFIDKYMEALETTMLTIELKFDKLNLKDKIILLLDQTNDVKKDKRLGALVGLFLIIKRYKIEEETVERIILKLIDLLHNYDNQDEMFLVACMEILYLFANNNIVVNQVTWISTLITDFSYMQLKKTAFNLLIATGQEGLKVNIIQNHIFF